MDMTTQFAATGKVALVAAALCAALAPAPSFATNLDDYYFRYDFTSGQRVFHGSDAVTVDPMSDTSIKTSDRSDMTELAVDGPDGANTAAHPMGNGWSQVNATTFRNALNADWTFALSLRPGSTQNGVIFSIGRRNSNNLKNISICASSDPTKLLVDENQRVSNVQTRYARIELDNNVDVSSGFHTVVVVYRMPASGNAGTLEFYVDGVYQKSYTTLNYAFNAGFQFCTTCSGCVGEKVGDETVDMQVATSGAVDHDVAFRDVRFYPSAFSSSDARRYAALYPATGTLRKSAFVRSFGVNYVDTGYYVTPTTRVAADYQFISTSAQSRIFGEDCPGLDCYWYISNDGRYNGVMNDQGIYTGSYLPTIRSNTRRAYTSVDRVSGKSIVQQDGTDYEANLSGTGGVNNATLPLTLFAQNNTNGVTRYSTLAIYSFDIDTDGVPVCFFAPATNETGAAGFYDVIGGTFHGDSAESPSTALAYYDGFGSAADYKYENGTLYAKVYVASADAAKGSVAVSDGGGAALTPEEDGGYWVAYGTTLTLTATPASGLVFSGWAGDVRTITSGAATDASVEVTIDKAAQFEARFAVSPDAEIFHTSLFGRFAKRAEDLDVGDYVQDHLVLHYDGIRNAGADAPHSSDTNTWVNLGSLGSGYDGVLTSFSSPVSGTSAGAWRDTGYRFNGKDYFYLGGTYGSGRKIALGGAITVQVISDDYAYSARKTNYPQFFGATAGSDQFGIYFNHKDSTDTEKQKIRFKLNGATTHASAGIWYTPYVNAMYDAAAGQLSIDGDVLPDWQTANTTASVAEYQYNIGTARSSAADRAARALVGSVNSMRVYTNVLTDAQLEWNRIVDDARYFGGGVDVDLVVASNSRGFEGVEPAGAYMVNGSHTFSATNIVDGLFTWSPVGCRIEKWTDGEWVSFKNVEGSSFAYTNCLANGKMRLTWFWMQTGAIKGGYGVGDYIQYDQGGSPLAHFDGILNAGADAAHETSPSEWVDLTGHFNMATNGAPAFAGDAWVSDGSSSFKGFSDTVKSALTAKTFTLEMMISHPSSQNKYEYWSYFGASDSSRQLVVDLRKNDSSNKLVQGVQYRAAKWADAAKVSSVSSGMKWNTRQYIAVVCNGGNAATAYYDGTNIFHTISGSTNPSTNQFTVGASYGGGNVLYKGSEICAVRMTAGALDAWQIAYNNAIDQVRFNGNVTVVNGAIGDTGAAGASAVADGIYMLESGTWTITAPKVKEGGKTYRPKVLVETYNAATGEWTATTAKPVWADSYTVDKTELGDTRIRLTWTWEMPKGFMFIVK
ncbi:MAG: hypothetical protein IJI54_00375 [Kiritimatiellae bacterium]|nr:hypothetical protein [Kiritimatiellia bacterium]